MQKKKRSKALQAVLWFVGLLLFGGILSLAGLDALKQIAKSDIRYLAVTLITVACLTAATSLRWGLIANAMAGRKLTSWIHYYHYNILGRVTGLFVPQVAGDIGTRTIALTVTKSSSLGLAFSSTVIDRMFDALGTAVLFVPSLLFVTKVVTELVAGLLSMMCILALVALIHTRWSALWHSLMKLFDLLARVAMRLPLLKKVITPQRVEMLQELADRPISSKLALQVYLLSMMRILLMIVRSYSVAVALGIHAPFVSIYLIVPVAQLLMLFAITPMGLGLRELGWAGILTLIGASRSDALVFALGHRAYLYITVAILGLVSYASLMFERRRDALAPAPTAPNPGKETDSS